ncbi:unnamed protein product [Allacma fusca]|uniref:Uncharacterized protein n=1 Tax=Allacma fusca TaxID=39272 RepID=A0A8J2J6Y4_9HEXA|nr:unnamed protein product [Allacma fusca]
MPNSSDMQPYLKVFCFLSKLRIVPFHLSFEGHGRVVMKRDRRRFIWNLFFLYGFFRTWLSIYNFVMIWRSGTAPTYELSIHALEILASVAVTGPQILSFMGQGEITAAIFSFIFKGTGERSTETHPKRSHSLQESFAAYLMQIVYSECIGLNILAAIFCTKVHLYQNLPVTLQNPFIFLLCFIHEILFWIGRPIAFILCVSNMLLFFEDVSRTLISEIRFIRSNPSLEPSELQKLQDVCRKTEVVVRLFNIGHSALIYFFKMLFLSASIFGFFFGIHLLPINRPVSLYLMYLGVFAFTSYCVTFDKAFRVPASMDTLKNEVTKCMQLSRSSKLRREIFEKRMQAIANVGIKK